MEPSEDGSITKGPDQATGPHKRMRSSEYAEPNNDSASSKKPRLQQDSTIQVAHKEDAQSHSAPLASTGNQYLPVEVEALSHKYDFTSMSILTSSKMEQKVRLVIERVSKFSFADVNGKPGVVILHAKASAANKLIGIVELAKREIERDRGKWFQYSKLESEVLELKLKTKQKPQHSTGMSISDWERKKGGQEAANQPSDDAAEQAEDEDVAMTGNDGGDNQEADDNDENEEPAFETMTELLEKKKKIRAVPVMIVYLAMVPVSELKQSYGYVTSFKVLRFRTNLHTLSSREQSNALK